MSKEMYISRIGRWIQDKIEGGLSTETIICRLELQEIEHHQHGMDG